MYTSNSKEDNLFLSRADDVVALSSMRKKPCFFGFLNEMESYILQEYLSWNSENIYFYGGYESAKRVMLCCSENHITEDDFPVKAVYFKYRTADKLSHRDFLGALMSLGIERSCVGDILVGEGYAVCYALKQLVFRILKYQADAKSRLPSGGLIGPNILTIQQHLAGSRF